MFNPLRMWRHHLSNEAHRRYIANNPTPREIQRAQRRAAGPDTGTRCTPAEWESFVSEYLPSLLVDRAIQRRVANKTGNAILLQSLERPVTWQMLLHYAKNLGATGLRPPREIEAMIERTGQISSSLVGQPTQAR